MAVTMRDSDIAKINQYKQDYANATTQAERDAAHAAAEAIRASYGFSGGVDGSESISLKPNNYGGSSTSVGTYTPEQQAIVDQMNANSQKWYDVGTWQEQEQLHRENQELAGLLGGSVSYDPGTGYWSGEAAQTTQKKQQQQQSQVAGVMGGASSLGWENYINDYSTYLSEMYAAKKEAALAELEAAYKQNVAAIDRAENGLAESYQNARNQAAGASELAARNFAQYAAANGLNSGTGGQAELARNIALQNDLNGINTTEAQSFADIQLQRANAETNYNNAIAQAEAEGNYQLAAALYQEKVRVDEELLNLAITQYQLEYQAYRDSVADSQWQQSFDQGVAQQNWSNNFAQTQYNNALLQQEWENTLAKLKYDAGLKDNTEMTLSVAAAMAEYGQFTDESLAVFYKNGFTEDYLKAKYGYQPPSKAEEPLAGEEPAGYQFAKSLYNSTKNADYVYRTLKASGYSDAEIDTLMALLGL